MEKKTKKAKENKQIVEIHIYIHHCYQIPIYPVQYPYYPYNPITNPIITWLGS